MRKIEKEVAKVAESTTMVDGRRVYEITESNLNQITTKYENLRIRELGGETIINTNHTYYQIYTKVAKSDEAITKLQKKLGVMLLPR
jgi:hypothetical protein